MNIPSEWLQPGWSAPGVGALMTTRGGGASETPFDSFNLRVAVGDAPSAVDANRRALARATGAVPVWLDQVHGARVVRLGPADLQLGAPVHAADGSVTTEPGLACAVQVADCLPVLFAAPGARAVGAAHAGWRGLALGVLEATLAEVCAAAACAPHEVGVWLGACIGPTRFEVGADVPEAFGVSGSAASPRFVAQPAVGTGPKWLADLPGLARDRLQRAGARAITGGTWCTVGEPSRFFSFRRDRVTGRMAALVWITRGAEFGV